MGEHEELEIDPDVLAEDSQELREGSSAAGAELHRLETLERHGLLTNKADQDALAVHRDQDVYDPDYVKIETRIPMPLSEKERQQLEALMAKDKEPDPDANTLIEIEIEGRVIRVPYGKAKPWLKKQGIDLDDILEEGAGEEEEEEEEEFDPEAEGGTDPKVVRRSPAKKVAAKKAAAAPEPVVTRGRSYWRKEA